MAQPSLITLALNSIAGRSQSGYPTTNPNNNWRIDSPFQLEYSFDMIPVHPRPMGETGAMAYYKWANTYMDYTVRLCWFGGEAPYRITLYRAPVGAYVGTGGTEQVWTRVPIIGTDPLLYRHDKPEKLHLVTHTFTEDDIGQTFAFKAMVESQSNNPIFFEWEVTVDNSKFRWFDVVNGNNANAGTFASPYADFPYGYNLANSQNYINVYKAGTYAVHNGVSGNSAAMDSTHCKSHIAYEAGVVFNFDGGALSAGTTDLAFINIATEGGLPTMASGNIRQFNLSERSHRLHLRGITFNTDVEGNSHGDNPCGVMTWDQSPQGSFHDYVSLVDCTLAPTSIYSMAIFFSTRYSVDENNYANGMDAKALANGAMVIHYKDGNWSCSSRLNDFTAANQNGIVTVSNQSVLDCANMDINFSRWVNTRSGGGYVCRWNGQVTVGTRPINQYIQRCSIDALNSPPFSFETYVGGDDVNYSGILWESTYSTLLGSGSEGGDSIGNASTKVSDINTPPSNTYGIAGATIISTLVSA